MANAVSAGLRLRECGDEKQKSEIRSRRPDAPKEMRHLGDLENPMTIVVKHAHEAETIDLDKLPTEKLAQLGSILASAMSSEPEQIGNG